MCEQLSRLTCKFIIWIHLLLHILLTKAFALVGTGYILCPYLVTPPQFHIHCTIDFIVLVSSTLNLFKASFSDERGQTVEYRF